MNTTLVCFPILVEYETGVEESMVLIADLKFSVLRTVAEKQCQSAIDKAKRETVKIARKYQWEEDNKPMYEELAPYYVSAPKGLKTKIAKHKLLVDGRNDYFYFGVQGAGSYISLLENGQNFVSGLSFMRTADQTADDNSSLTICDLTANLMRTAEEEYINLFIDDSSIQEFIRTYGIGNVVMMYRKKAYCIRPNWFWDSGIQTSEKWMKHLQETRNSQDPKAREQTSSEQCFVGSCTRNVSPPTVWNLFVTRHYILTEITEAQAFGVGKAKAQDFLDGYCANYRPPTVQQLEESAIQKVFKKVFNSQSGEFMSKEFAGYVSSENYSEPIPSKNKRIEVNPPAFGESKAHLSPVRREKGADLKRHFGSDFLDSAQLELEPRGSAEYYCTIVELGSEESEKSNEKRTKFDN